MEESGRVVVKLTLGAETHRMKMELSSFTYEALLEKVDDLFPVKPKRWGIVYTDNEGDLITVTKPLEFTEACRVFLQLSGERKVVHFRVVSTVTFKDQIAPVLHAVDEISTTLSRMAVDTKSSLRKSEYVERGRESLVYSASQTKELLGTARREVTQRLRRLKSAVERRRSSSGASNNAPEEVVDIVVTAAAVGVDNNTDEEHAIDEEDKAEAPADDLAAAEQEGEEGEEDDDEEEDAPPALIPVETMEGREEEEEVAYESDADTVDTMPSDAETDREWSLMPADVAAVASEWGAELEQIRAILPDVDEFLCCDLLDKHNGNLEMVLIELTDM